MATSSEIYAALRIIGVSCRGVGSGDTWAAEVAAAWAPEIKHVQSKHVAEAARTWMRSEDRRPSLHQFTTLLKQVRGRDIVNDQAQGCVECQSSGWRDVVVHYMPERGNRRKADEYTVPCDCEKGRFYAQSVDNRTFEQVLASFRRQPGFIELHYTDRNQLSLPLSMRIAPHQYQQLKKRPRRMHLAWENK